MNLSVIIVTHNSATFILDCLASLRESTSSMSHEIIIVDNHSGDNTQIRIREFFDRIILVENRENIGFARAVNMGVRKSCGEICLLLNPDVIVKTKNIQPLFQFLRENPRVGICGGKLLNPDDSLQYSKGSFATLPSILLRAFLPKRIRKYDLNGYDQTGICDWVTGAFMFIRRSLIEEIGLFDERFFLYYEDMDYCLNAQKKGWDTFFFPLMEAYHLAPYSSSPRKEEVRREVRKSRLHYFRKNNYLFSYYILFILTGLFEGWTFIPKPPNVPDYSADSSERR